MRPFLPGFRQLALRALAATVIVLSCTSSPLPEGQCLFNDDCASPLVCANRYCRAVCRTERDCGSSAPVCGASGVVGLRVCLPRDAPRPCVYSSECDPPLVCARDGVCRTECRADYDCTVTHPHLACLDGTCGTRCPGGLADCDGNLHDGCEVNLATSSTHCGACGRACLAGQVCSMGACRTTCGEGLTACGTSCVNLQTDGMNCGACGRACPSGQACSSGACAIVCGTDLTLCGTACVNLQTDGMNCGACGRACLAANATAACRSSACAVGSCNAGFGDCDASPANGCEVDTATSLAHCGACGRACVAPTNGGASCAAGTCTLRCDPGFALSGTTCTALTPPHPVSPLSGSRVGTPRPTLRWTVPAGAVGSLLQVCRDRACTTLELQLEVTGTSARPTLDLPAGAHYWRVLSLGSSLGSGTVTTRATFSPTWQVFVPRSGSADVALGQVGDFNGDGRVDLVTSAPFASGELGEVYVFQGTSTGLPAAPTLTLRGTTGSGFGSGLALAGDVDGDGFPDLLVGAPGGGSARTGEVYVFRGSATGLGATPSGTIPRTDGFGSFGGVLAGLGDVNGDGYSDVAVAVPDGETGPGSVVIYLGSASGLVTRPALQVTPTEPRGAVFGESILGGDYNQDGFSDLLVRLYPFSTGRAQVQVFQGSATGLATTATATLSSPTPSAEGFAGAVSSAGDVNGDGLLDLAVGAPSYGEGDGRVYVFLGRRSAFPLEASQTLEVPAASGGGGFGAVLTSVGDADGDGFGDLAVSAPNAGAVGNVMLYRGSATGLTATPATSLRGPSGKGVLFGSALAGLGDVNADGLYDLAVGAPGVNHVQVFLGSATGLSSPPAFDLTLTSPTAGGDFGGALAR